MTYVQWNPRFLKPPVCYMSPELIVPPCRNYWCRSTNNIFYKTCSCGRDTWHIESKHILQPPKYLIIIVIRITYSNNRITKNKSRMPLYELYIKLGPSKFSLQASVDHHGYSMNSDHYTASINCCRKTFHCNDNKITECNITDTYNSSTAYILLYKLIMEC